MNKKLIKAISIIAKIFEICFWVFGGIAFAFTVIAIVFNDRLNEIIQAGLNKGYITISGINANDFFINEEFNILACIFALILGVIQLVLCAMICKNISHIFNSEKPFAKENIRRVRDIGIYAIAAPIIKIIINIILCVIVHCTTNIKLDILPLFFGLVILGLSCFFSYGYTIEKDVDGLV